MLSSEGKRVCPVGAVQIACANFAFVDGAQTVFLAEVPHQSHYLDAHLGLLL